MSIWEYSFVYIRYQTISKFDMNVNIIFLTFNLSNRTCVFYVGPIVDPVKRGRVRWLTY